MELWDGMGWYWVWVRNLTLHVLLAMSVCQSQYKHGFAIWHPGPNMFCHMTRFSRIMLWSPQPRQLQGLRAAWVSDRTGGKLEPMFEVRSQFEGKIPFIHTWNPKKNRNKWLIPVLVKNPQPHWENHYYCSLFGSTDGHYIL